MAEIFKEPKVEDTSVVRDETYMKWLVRNTSPKAKYSRALLNKNISKIPDEWIDKLLKDLENRWSSAFFELIVARVIQVLGASVTVEKEQAGKNPDFIADFQNHKLTIEATSTVTDSDFREFTKRNEDLIRRIEEATPENWSFIVNDLPRIGYNDSKKEFRIAISELMASISESKIKEGDFIKLERELSNGIISLDLFYKTYKAKRLTGAMDSETYAFTDRIAKSMSDKRKRKQAKSSDFPVILAINLDGMKGSYEDFDVSLFGHSWENISYNTIGFDADGIFTTRIDKTKKPTYAGILAFFNVGLWGWSEDPILYLNPSFDEKLPDDLLNLRVRHYDIEKNNIFDKPKTYSFNEIWKVDF